jgi:hypothetical protein
MGFWDDPNKDVVAQILGGDEQQAKLMDLAGKNN